MKNLYIPLIILFNILLFSNCTKDELQSSVNNEFIFLDSSKKELFFQREEAGVKTDAGVRVILHSQAENPVAYTFEILESSTAVKDLHYSVESLSGIINASSVVDTLPIKIISSNLIPCEVVSLDLKLTSADVERVSTGTLTINLNLESASELAGVVNYVHTDNFVGADLTGSVTITALQTSGDYILSDFSFGAWPAAYNIDPPSGNLKWSNICSKITLSGTDNYGDVWKMDEILSSGGPEFTFTWSNTYGEFGKVTLTKEDGSFWPTLSL